MVPTTRVEECGGKPVLLVEGFDVIPDGGRRHMLSFQTLLKAEGFYQLRYEDLLGIVRKYSDDPLDDSIRLYRQMWPCLPQKENTWKRPTYSESPGRR